MLFAEEVSGSNDKTFHQEFNYVQRMHTQNNLQLYKIDNYR